MVVVDEGRESKAAGDEPEISRSDLFYFAPATDVLISSPQYTPHTNVALESLTTASSITTRSNLRPYRKVLPFVNEQKHLGLLDTDRLTTTAVTLPTTECDHQAR